MRRPSSTIRSLAVALALFQAGAAPVASIVDAMVPRRGAESHVEDHTRRRCVPAHPDDCALCRAISLPAEPAPAPLPASGAGAGVHVGLSCDVPAFARIGPRLPRAPPAT